MDPKQMFINDCIEFQADEIVQKYLLDGSSYYFNENKKFDEFLFKKDIASSLNVHLREIVIVGSAKLGFSIKPDETVPDFFPFKKFDDNRVSDLDIAIVSNDLFDLQLMKLYEHTSHYVNQSIWNNNRHRNFLAQYALKGWLKPEFIPANYEFSSNINEVLNKYKMKFGRDVNIGIYKSWYFFESYHRNNIRNINLNLIANG